MSASAAPSQVARSQLLRQGVTVLPLRPPSPCIPTTTFPVAFGYRDANPRTPPWRPHRGLHGFSWGPPSTAATQLLRSERGGAAPPLASPPPTGGDASPLLLLLGRARVARPPKQKWNRPRPSFLFSIKNWKEESWKRAKRGGEMHLSSVGERDADGYGGGPQERGGVGPLGGGGGGNLWWGGCLGSCIPLTPPIPPFHPPTTRGGGRGGDALDWKLS
nr:hypothetical protein [Morchella crassipes]